MKKKDNVKSESNIVELAYGGSIDYSEQFFQEVKNKKNLSHEDIINIQKSSVGKVKGGFQKAYYNIGLVYKGQIEKKNDKYICFQRIFIEGMYPNGVCFDGKEQHVWIDIDGFENYKVGDCLEFGAEVYPYLKTRNGKVIDFGLRNPSDIHIIERYELLTDEELLQQSLDEIICETCFISEQCNGTYCILENNSLRK